MSATITATVTQSAQSFDPLAISLSTTWATYAYDFLAEMESARCLDDCPDIFAVNEPCYSSYLTPWASLMTELESATDDAKQSSVMTVMNDLDYTMLTCMCKKTELSPWLTAATGVCDHGTYTSCANPASTELVALTGVHNAFSSMCGSLGVKAVDATTTAESSNATGSPEKIADAAGTTGTSASQTAPAGSGSVASKKVVTLTGALLVGFVGLAVVL